MRRRWQLAEIGAVILETAGVFIAVGGLYDLLMPHLPPNLTAICAGNVLVERLVRELLRALGGALVAVGTTTSVLVAMCGRPLSHFVLILTLVLVLPAEGVNALGMYRVKSPYQIPLAFVALALIGVLLSWPRALR